MKCAYMFGSSRTLFMSIQSYFLSEICVPTNQLHSYCLPTVILAPPCYTCFLCTVLDLHKSFGATFMPFLLDDLNLLCMRKTYPSHPFFTSPEKTHSRYHQKFCSIYYSMPWEISRGKALPVF